MTSRWSPCRHWCQCTSTTSCPATLSTQVGVDVSSPGPATIPPLCLPALVGVPVPPYGTCYQVALGRLEPGLSCACITATRPLILLLLLLRCIHAMELPVVPPPPARSGLVFVPLSQPYLHEYGDDWMSNR